VASAREQVEKGVKEGWSPPNRSAFRGSAAPPVYSAWYAQVWLVPFSARASCRPPVSLRGGHTGLMDGIVAKAFFGLRRRGRGGSDRYALPERCRRL